MQRSKIEQLMISRLIIRIDIIYNSSAVFLCGAEDVWCGNQEIVGVGNRHDNKYIILS